MTKAKKPSLEDRVASLEKAHSKQVIVNDLTSLARRNILQILGGVLKSAKQQTRIMCLLAVMVVFLALMLMMSVLWF